MMSRVKVNDNEVGFSFFALAVAGIAHAGQVDKAGRDYIEHPVRVSEAVAEFGDAAVAVALLHDVIEDSDFTDVMLFEMGFTKEIVEAVVLLTRVAGVSPESYYEKIRGNKLALLVKIADIKDNCNEARLSLLDESVAARLRSKYSKALALLT